MKIFDTIDRKISPISNELLLAEVFLFIFVIPFLPTDWRRISGQIMFSLIFLTSIFALNSGRKTIFSIALLAFITEWMTIWIKMPLLNYLSLLTNILFFQIIVIKLIIQIARSNKANARVIFESISGYLMLGLMFTTWIAIAMLYDPAAINFNVDNPTAQDFTYFTFVTMTTLGYGDITPVVPFAKALSILISTSGQIYVAVIIAMLVGKYAGSKKD